MVAAPVSSNVIKFPSPPPANSGAAPAPTGGQVIQFKRPTPPPRPTPTITRAPLRTPIASGGAVPGGGIALGLMPYTQALADYLARKALEAAGIVGSSPINDQEVADTEQPRYEDSGIEFTGGQIPGVQYNVFWRFQETNGITNNNGSSVLIGPISGSTVTLAYVHPVYGPYYDFKIQSGNGEILIRQAEGGFNYAEILSVERVDGQPDSDENPDPVPVGDPIPRGPSRFPFTPQPQPGPAPFTSPRPEPPPGVTRQPGASPRQTYVPNPGSGANPYQNSEYQPGRNPIGDPSGLPQPAPIPQPPGDFGFPGQPGGAENIEVPKAPTQINIFDPNAAIGAGIGAAVGTAIVFGKDGLPGPNNIPEPAPAQTPQNQTRCSCNKAGDTLLQALNTALTGAGTALDASVIGKLNIINNKLGAQVAGGISGAVQRVDQFIRKAYEVARIDKVIQALTLVTVIHNAALLSRELGETLGELTSQMLAVIGIKDEEGNALDVNGLVGGAIEDWIVSIVGEDVYTGVKQNWLKANRIISSATNIIWTIRSISDGTQEVMEWIGENTGKIGNALKRWGVVGERAYPWMTERVRAQDAWRRKMGRILDGLEQAEDTASSLYAVTSEVREIQEEISELGEQRQAFQQAVSDALPSDRPDNAPVQTDFQADKTASQSPDVAFSDVSRGTI